MRPKVLPDDLAPLQRAGIVTLVSLLEPSEADAIGLHDEAAACVASGLCFLNHPIRDMHLPDPETFLPFATDIAARLRAGENIALHCHASIGRSGMLACTVLGHFDYTAARAIEHTSKRRGVPIPDTAAQTAFIHRMIAQLRS